MDQHPLYPLLQCTTRILAENGISYVLSSGTQLGAVRESAMISHDQDFDIDIFAGDLPRLRDLGDQFASNGLILADKMAPGARLCDGYRGSEADRFASAVQLLHEGNKVGDLFLFTIFSDGIARRYDPVTTIYYNPRHQNPAWYYEQPAIAEIYGDPYPIMRDAHVALESMYGPQWRTPIAPGDHGPGSHRSGGAVVDRDLEAMISHAVKAGWDSDYSDCPAWPPTITHVNSFRARRWVLRNEPLVDITGQQNRPVILPLPSDVGIADAMAARNEAVRALRQASDATAMLEGEKAAKEAEKLLDTRRRLAAESKRADQATKRADQATRRLEATRRRLAEQQAKMSDLRRNPLGFMWRYGVRKLRRAS